MKIQLLPSTIDENGKASARQHLLSIVIDDCVAIDAGCLAFSCSELQREQVRDIVLTHTHLDHIAGLPLFIDDLFASLTEPIRIHATGEMIAILERDIFNWAIYPRFSELVNDNGPVVKYHEFTEGSKFEVKHLKLQSIRVQHEVSTDGREVDASGYIVSDENGSIAITGDTAETDEIWDECNKSADLKAVFVECAFPDELLDLAKVSHHLTPSLLKRELKKLENKEVPVYVINLKPMYREVVMQQLSSKIPQVKVLDVGRVYEL